ncbi:MAG: spore cortex biosynthesis protein YabQ, partial [Oscillospiraceae bacterium]|nr:spore cortex biosynthesis protein YabQ [Oscillospiraceae bacterium]
MEVSLAAQAVAFGGALVLGLILGVVYDLFRLLRLRIPVRVVGGFLDLLYWPLTVCVLFLYTVTVGDGEVRAYLMLGIALGSLCYFRLFSGFARFLGDKLADLLAYLGRLSMIPVRAVKNFLKKFGKNAKNLFHYRRKWYKIKKTIGGMGLRPSQQ